MHFTFKIRIGGQDNFVIKQANLANVPPEYYLIRANNLVPNIDTIEYGPGSSPVLPLPAFVPVRTKKDALNIAFIYGNNGSANKDETITGGALSTRDLAYISQTLDFASGALQDAGGTPTYQQFEIDMRVTLNQDNFWNKSQEGKAIPIDNPYWGNNSQYYFDNQGEVVCGANCLRSDMGPFSIYHHYPATIFTR